MPKVQLGLGLVSIGRRWGFHQVAPPSNRDAIALLTHAVDLGIRFFDTAPAYATSEHILGQFLNNTETPRDKLVIATKMGEFWNDARGDSVVSHAYDDLVASIEKSISLLGSIDILQVHKATKANLGTSDLMKSLDYAEAKGVKAFGASVSDYETALQACESNRFTFIQFPYNSDSTQLHDIFDLAKERGIKLLINRPLAMGKLASDVGDRGAIERAFKFILQEQFDGWVLTGTSSPLHLSENIKAFMAARS